jgi:hypothetical protein
MSWLCEKKPNGNWLRIALTSQIEKAKATKTLARLGLQVGVFAAQHVVLRSICSIRSQLQFWFFSDDARSDSRQAAAVRATR